MFISGGADDSVKTNRKGRQFPGGLLVKAGNHLRSHTLTLAEYHPRHAPRQADTLHGRPGQAGQAATHPA